MDSSRGTWLADLCAQEGSLFVLGHALSLKAIHGGKATHDHIDAQTIAVRLRGGMLLQAYVYPAAMRAPRDLLRRRRHCMRHRAARLTPVQHTNRQDHRPEMGRQSADNTNRDGVAERCAEPAGQQSLEGDLALLGPSDERLRDVERSILQAAQPPDAHTRARRRTVPGSGEMLSLVQLDEMHASQRFPRGQACASYGRLVTCAQEAAGTRDGTSGTKIGHADLPSACSEAAVRVLRAHPAGPTYLGRREQKPSQGTALTVWAHKLARAGDDLLTRDPAVEMHTFRTGSRARSGRAWRLTGP